MPTTDAGQQEVFPFTAIVGQENMKLGLVLNAINPRIHGILIRGERGTAKSTAVRALADVLNEIFVVANCPYSCDPFQTDLQCPECRARAAAGEALPVTKRRMRVVNLPLNASEDRLVGTLDLERALQKGERRFEHGVLARANRGILYVDEVNLLDDYLVDLLLDAAAMGVNRVEREGVSYQHPAAFMLVGTMNPEEGDLRPQLEDRFGLCVDIAGIRDVDQRVEVTERWEEFATDPRGFSAKWEPEQRVLAERISAASTLLNSVTVAREQLRLIAEVNSRLEVDGHRGDIVMREAAQALAAFNGRKSVPDDDIFAVAEPALTHRLRRRPLERVGQPVAQLIAQVRREIERHSANVGR